MAGAELSAMTVYTLVVQETVLDEKHMRVQVKAGGPSYMADRIEVQFTVSPKDAARYHVGKVLRFFLDEDA